ncbi:DUF3352 domain-containing protein [Leptolyngbya iicbica]|uniref:DUF3352 domain-containing protein n=2 Tax=Cyanophyceae TaxID=3028117 RepID=A0A4Q7EF44_9CYAN|nr:DUF3352 domain-containing protein [Leptolyngbya sp. LK]RZM81833.1 DUF3352 domain-containing protein [Leptolyngbya sp. LK]
MKSRTVYSAIAILAGILLLVGIAGFWGLTSQNPRGLITRGGQAQPQAAQFVPRQSPLMVSLLARPDRLWQLRQLLTPANQRFQVRQEWQSLQQSLEDLVGWDYEADVRPWLDEEATLAITAADLDYDASNGLQPGYLVVLSCRDAEAAREALHRLWQQRAVQRNLRFETVSGISLISDQALATTGRAPISGFSANLALETLATTMIGDRYVLLANDAQVLRQAIATYQAPDVSWVKAAPYHTAITTLPENRVGWLVANIPQLLAWFGDEKLLTAPPISPTGQQAHLAFISFQALAEGLLGNTAIATHPLSSVPEAITPPQATSARLPAAISLVPESALFVTAGAQLSQQLQSLSDNIGGYPIAQQAIAALLQSWSLTPESVPAGLSAALAGDYALALLPGDRPDWALITAAATTDLAALDDFAAGQGLTVNRLTYNEQPLTTWTRFTLNRTRNNAPLQLTTQVIAAHTTVQNHEVLSTSLEGLQQVLQQVNQGSLADQTTLMQLTEELPTLGSELIYIDWPALLPSLQQRFPWLLAVEAATQPFSQHIGPILISDRPTASALQMGTVAIQLRENPAKMS